MDFKSFTKSRLFFSILSFIIPFIVYLRTMAPDVSFIDCGELATSCIKLGICHPTGYPLFTILGHLFSYLPFSEEIFRISFMCGVISSLAVVVFFNLLVFIFKELYLNDDIKKENSKNHTFAKGLDDLTIYFISFASSLILAFSFTFWNVSNSIEVYSLHSLYLISIIFVMLKASHLTLQVNKEMERYWILFGFLVGLAFTNHLSSIFLGVGCLYLYFTISGLNNVSYKRLALIIIFFLIAFSVYIYYPLRADNPWVSWGYPKNLYNFYRHISGKQFSVWMFSSTEVTSKQFAYFTTAFPKEFFYFPLIFSVLGLIEIFRNQRKLFYFTVLLFAFNVFYAINYDIHDIDSYFLLAYIVNTIWIAFGILFMIKKSKTNMLQLSIASILLAVVILVANYKKNDESDNYFVKDYTMNVFKSAPGKSLIISSQWDFCVSASWYYQMVKGIRPDIALIDKELLRKTWYIRHIQIHYPEIYERSKTEFEIYNTELIKFEKETNRYTNPQTEADRQDLMKINTAFMNLLNSMVERNYNDYGIYTTSEIEQATQERFGKEYTRIPEGILFRYVKEKTFPVTPEPELQYTITNEKDYYHNFIMNAYYNYYMQRANYLMNKSEFDTAEKLLDKATELSPQDRTIMNLKNKISQLKSLPKNP